MLATITLPPQLAEPLEQLAKEPGASVQQIVEEMLIARNPQAVLAALEES